MSRWLTTLLALVIALQSLLAIGDVNLPHHPAAPHHSYSHEHSPGTRLDHSDVPDSAQAASSSAPASEQFSEHSPEHSTKHNAEHCVENCVERCHQNHAHIHLVMAHAVTDIAAVSANQSLPDYQVDHTSTTLSSLFRPPIA